jgi:hypothetical protein
MQSRLSFRTWTPKRTSAPALRPIAQRSSLHTSHSRSASSWQATPAGSVTHFSQTAR